MKIFEKWDTQDVEDTFSIRFIRNFAPLQSWLKNDQPKLNDFEKMTLTKLQNWLIENADFWNEDELKMQFIAPILSLVNFQTPYFKPFSQRPLSALIQSIPVSGKVEYMLAHGKQRPKNPFFFLHEYKQETKRDSDPKGQLLISLLAAQTLNNDHSPLFGCYVVGRMWFFMVLEKQEYEVSLAYDATQSDLYKIIGLLQYIKQYLIALHEQQP